MIGDPTYTFRVFSGDKELRSMERRCNDRQMKVQAADMLKRDRSGADAVRVFRDGLSVWTKAARS